MKKECVFLFIVFLCHTFLRAQTGIVEDAIGKLQKGDATGLQMTLYTNNATGYAVAFIKKIGMLEDESKRRDVVWLSASLVRRSAESSGRKDDRDLESFVVEMVKLLKEDSSEKTRRLVAQNLMETVSTNVLDHYQSAIRLAADERKDIDTLQLYASLPSCDVPWLMGIVRIIKPETKLQQYRLDSIMARHGDQAATGRLITEAGGLLETCDYVLAEYIKALVFVRSERVQKYLATDLRSEAVLVLAGGDKLPWRNCCAYMLSRIHKEDKNFPVKRSFMIYGFRDDDLIKIERWCNNNLNISFPSQRKSIIYNPNEAVYPLREKGSIEKR